ncbi:hypothetical protein ACIGG9_15615 [Pseudonocardia alni]|uniref:hypothetical protein n=1 Tax=Pseudonocardia alni TaxID=33907 RepID=UPI0033F272DE
MVGGTPTGNGPWVRYGRMALGVLAVVAMLVLETVLLGDRIAADLRRITGGAPDAPARAVVAARAPSPPAEPAANGAVAGVDLRPLDTCRDGASCPVRLQVRLTGPGPAEVTWRARVDDLCTGVRTESPDRRLPVPAGPGGRLDVVTDVVLPRGAALAVSPLVTAPAVAVGAPMLLPARPECTTGAGR